MKLGIGLAVIALLAGADLRAQGVSTITIGTSVGPGSGPYFYVDGQQFSSSQTFIWPLGSKHIVQFPMSVSLEGNVLPYQSGNFDAIRYSFGGWVTNGPTLNLAQNTEQVITATPELTRLTANLTVLHKVHIQFYANAPGNGNCNDPIANPSLDGRRYGVVYVANVCFGDTADTYLPAGATALSAFPFPGFVFTGWNINGTVTESYLSSFNLAGSITITPMFMPAKRVRFNSDPPGLKIIVDSSTIQLPAGYPQSVLPPQNIDYNCSPNYTKLPVGTPLGVTPLCVGDFDFLPGSVHKIGAPQSQMDDSGVAWVFAGYSNGLGQNATYIPDGNIANVDNLTAKFVPGISATILTSPTGLKVEVDGRSNWPGYTFVWGAGEKHTISAPATQVDSKGRRYRFIGWANSNNGGTAPNLTDGAAQEITVPNDRSGIALKASYQILGQVQLTTDPQGLAVTVDGVSCTTPCTLDKDPGETAQVSIPKTISRTAYSRFDFDAWSGGEIETVRSIKFNSDVQVIRASYHNAYLLVANSDPANQVNFTFAPTSPDGFFADGTQITVTVTPKGGYKFRRWDGDLTGTFSTGYVTMNSPREIIARLDKVPFIPASGIKNAAGETPDGTVAPGSIIAIYGENLAEGLQVGPTNPLSQTLAGITVTVNDRLLPLLFVSSKQINAQVPSDLEDGTYTVKVKSITQPDVPGTMKVRRNAPGIFTQSATEQPLALAFHADGTVVNLDSPARRSETVTLYGTGFGPYDRRVIDGFIVPSDANYRLLDSVSVLTADKQLIPQWTGAAPGMVGTTIMRLTIGDDIPAASLLEMSVRVNGADSNKVLLPIQ